MAKLIAFNGKIREGLKRGVDTFTDAIKVTPGPEGRNVALNKVFGSSLITNDGVAIARDTDVEDPLGNFGVQLARSVAVRANDIAGDGTTTATPLAQALVHRGLRNVAADANPISLSRGIHTTSDKAVELLKQHAIPVSSPTTIAQVATVSSRDTGIGDLVAGTMDKVGKSGVVFVGESQSIAIELSVTEGVSFNRGFLSPCFVTDAEAQQAILDDAQVLLVREKISSLPEFLPILEKIAESSKPTLIMTEDIGGEALSTLIINAMRKTLRVAAVKAPYFGGRRKAFMDDLAAIAGTTVATADTDMRLKDVGLEVLGDARRITITKGEAVLVDGAGTAEAVEEHRNQIRAEVECTDSDWDHGKLEERPAKPFGSVVVIKVGATTETEVNEHELHVEDAINAARTAAQEGVIAGGGSILVQTSRELEASSDKFEGDKAVGIRAVAKALTRLAFWIAENVGKDGAIVVYHIGKLENGDGCNVATDTYGNLIKSGVIDPVKVTHSAVINTTPVTRMLLAIEAPVVDKPEEEPQYDHAH